MPSVVTPVNFGSAAERHRAEIADALAEVARLIRENQLEDQPHGWVLLLHSDAGYEVLNKGIRTKEELDRATLAIRRHIATT
jgi:hypothetical protein